MTQLATLASIGMLSALATIALADLTPRDDEEQP